MEGKTSPRGRWATLKTRPESEQVGPVQTPILPKPIASTQIKFKKIMRNVSASLSKITTLFTE